MSRKCHLLVGRGGEELEVDEALAAVPQRRAWQGCAGRVSELSREALAAVPQRRADAVRAGVSAADDDDVLAFCRDEAAAVLGGEPDLEWDGRD